MFAGAHFARGRRILTGEIAGIQPRWSKIAVAAVAVSGDVAEAGASHQQPFGHHADKMIGLKPFFPDDVWPKNRRLQPQAAMECDVPIADRRVIAPGRNLQPVVVVVADERARDVDRELVVDAGDVDFAKEAELSAERRVDVTNQIAEAESIVRLAIVRQMVVGGGKIDVGESTKVHGRFVRLCDSRAGQ